jgi:hypothetical protein
MKRIVILIGLLLINAALWGSQSHAIQPSIVKPDKIDLILQKAQLEAHLRQNMLIKVRKYIESQCFHSETKRIDFIRDWVYRNSIHKMDAEHDEYAFDNARVLFMLWRSHQTSKDYPHLSCGPRAYAMKAILDDLRIPNRMIVIFANNCFEINSHTFLEVFDRDTRNWELQDPDFDIYYIDIHNRKRLSGARLIWGDLNSVIPISQSKEGWEQNNVVNLKRDYFGAMMFVNLLDGEKSVMLINLDRFSADKLFGESTVTSFYEFACEHYEYPIFITGQGSRLSGGDNNWPATITAYFSGPFGRVPHPHFYH